MDMRSVEQIEAEVREKVRKEMKHFMKVEQYEPIPDDIYDELPPIKPILRDYSNYSDYKEYYDKNICNSRIEDENESI